MSVSVHNTALGQGLSINQRLSVSNALTKIKTNEKLGEVAYWGKVIGKERDYIIAQSIKLSNKIEKLFYFSHDNGITFAKLPDLDSFILEKVVLHSGRFSGNPSLKLRDPRPRVAGAEDEEEEDYDEEEEEEEDEEGNIIPKERKLTEMERLAYIVMEIDNTCRVIPRGSAYMDAFGNIRKTAAFVGLSFEERGLLDKYLLLRTPRNPRTLAQIQRAGACNNVEFLDSISLETPKSAWVIRVEATSATLRNLLYPGFEAKLNADGTVLTNTYVGLGSKNEDLAFML